MHNGKDVGVRDYYTVLGVARSASHEELRAAYRDLARRLHPDLHGAGTDGHEMRLVNAAWEVLGDPEQRQRYDATLEARAARSRDGLEPSVPRGFHTHPRTGWASRVHMDYRVADELRGALSLSADSADLSGLDDLADDEVWLLDLSEREITDGDLPRLMRFTRLEVLHLADTRVTDAGLKTLAKMSGLETLDLSDCNVSDAGLPALSPLSRLSTLLLFGTHVTDDGIPALSALPVLRVLDVRSTRVNGDSDALASLPGIHELRLSWRARLRARGFARSRPDVRMP